MTMHRRRRRRRFRGLSARRRWLLALGMAAGTSLTGPGGAAA